jgi:hypothetical protein
MLHQKDDEPLLLTEQLLHKLKHLELLNISFSWGSDLTRVVAPVRNYLFVPNVSLKHLCLHGYIGDPDANKDPVVTVDRNKINLKSLELHASARDFLSLIPEQSEINKLTIWLRNYEENNLLELKKSQAVFVDSLCLECMDYDITFSDIHSLLNNLVNLKNLKVKILYPELSNAQQWETMILAVKSLEKFSLKCNKCYNDPFTIDQQELLLNSFRTEFWTVEKKAFINEYSEYVSDRPGCYYVITVKF